MLEPETIVIEVVGGVVKTVRCTDPDVVRVVIVDRDNELYEDEPKTVIPENFRHCDTFGPPGSWRESDDSDQRLLFIKNLAVGDEVFWNDPDEGLCSRIGEIFQIETDDGKIKNEDSVIWLQFPDGGETQVYVREVQ